VFGVLLVAVVCMCPAIAVFESTAKVVKSAMKDAKKKKVEENEAMKRRARASRRQSVGKEEALVAAGHDFAAVRIALSKALGDGAMALAMLNGEGNVSPPSSREEHDQNKEGVDEERAMAKGEENGTETEFTLDDVLENSQGMSDAKRAPEALRADVVAAEVGGSSSSGPSFIPEMLPDWSNYVNAFGIGSFVSRDRGNINGERIGTPI